MVHGATFDEPGRTAIARRSHRYAPSVLVGVLGPLRVERDDVVVEVPRRMERRLLTALAATHPHEVTVDALVDALWAATPPASARKTLQTNVLRLRQALGAATIVTTADGYRLGADVRVDATEFERAGDLVWWRGEPFVELVDWPIAEGRRARLVELHRRAEDAAAEALLEADRSTDAVAELERLVADDPAREVRWTLLVRALVASDRRPEALRRTSGRDGRWPPSSGSRPAPSWMRLTAPRSPPTTWPADRRRTQHDPIVTVDRLLAAGAARWRAGDARAATATFVEAAGIARQSGDVRRFADATLGAAGDGVRVSLDATEEVTSLVREALAHVPPRSDPDPFSPAGPDVGAAEPAPPRRVTTSCRPGPRWPSPARSTTRSSSPARWRRSRRRSSIRSGATSGGPGSTSC